MLNRQQLDGTDATSQRRVRGSRLLLLAAGALALWAIVAAITGGVRFDVGPVRLSARNPTRPILLAVLLGVIAWRWHYEAWLESRLQSLQPLARVVFPTIVTLAAGSVLLMGMLWGGRAAGGADALGYVSEAALLRQRALRIDQSFALTMNWPHSEESLAPLGYRPSTDPAIMVPTYAAGLPLLMAAARSFSCSGPYYIGPIAGAMLVILTYLLGRQVFSAAAAVVAAVLMAVAPTLLYMSMAPMADVPAAACWIAAFVAARSSLRLRSSVTGLLTGLAIAIRPNLLPLALFPWLLLIARRDIRAAALSTLAFGAGLTPFVAGIAWMNNYLYGSPLMSGYGNLSPGFALENARANLIRYPKWWLDSQGILAFVFLVSIARTHTRWRREAVILIAFCAAVFLSYVFYIPFDVWWFLRFLLPAMPMAFLFCADAVQWATSHLSLTARFAALLTFTVVSLAHSVTFNRHLGLPQNGDGEQRYVDAGVFIERVTPPNAVIVSVQHSGSIRYYSGRLTLRYDLLPSEWLDRAIEALERAGRPVYLLLDGWEERAVRERFRGQRTLTQLDRGPLATGRAGSLLFYPINRAPVDQVSTRIPRTSRSDCRDISPGFWTAGASK